MTFAFANSQAEHFLQFILVAMIVQLEMRINHFHYSYILLFALIPGLDLMVLLYQTF